MKFVSLLGLVFSFFPYPPPVSYFRRTRYAATQAGYISFACFVFCCCYFIQHHRNEKMNVGEAIAMIQTSWWSAFMMEKLETEERKNTCDLWPETCAVPPFRLPQARVVPPRDWCMPEHVERCSLIFESVKSDVAYVAWRSVIKRTIFSNFCWVFLLQNMDIITSHSWNGDFTGSPCQPFVGMSFAVLVRYLPEYHNTKWVRHFTPKIVLFSYFYFFSWALSNFFLISCHRPDFFGFLLYSCAWNSVLSG